MSMSENLNFKLFFLFFFFQSTDLFWQNKKCYVNIWFISYPEKTIVCVVTSKSCSEQCFYFVFCFLDWKRCTARMRPIQPPPPSLLPHLNISAVWMYNSAVHPWTWSHVLFSWQRHGRHVVFIKYLLVHGLGFIIASIDASIRKTSAFLSSCGVDQGHPVYSILRTTNLHRRSWDMHNLHAWSSLIIAISYLTIFCKFGSNWNVHWIKPMAHCLLDTQQTTS